MNANSRRPPLSRTAPLLGVSVALLAVSAVPIAGGALLGDGVPTSPAPTSKAAPERHDPITILNDADLIPPDDVIGNGVRGGTGTPQDPYVIADWTISSSEETAIHIQDVHVWVEIRNVTIVQDALRDDSVGIFVHDVDHLTVAGVNVTGLQSTGIHVQESNVTIRDSRIAVRSTPDPDAEYPGGPIGTHPAIWDGRGVGISYHDDTSLRMVGNVFDRTPVFVKPECVCNGTDLTFVDNTVRPYSNRMDRGYFRGDRLLAAGNTGYVYYRLELNEPVQEGSFENNEAETLYLDTIGGGTEDKEFTAEVIVPVQDNTFRGSQDCSDTVLYGGAIQDPGCRAAVTLSVLSSRVRADITGNRFEQVRETAVDVWHSRVSVRANAFVDSGPTEEPRVWIRADHQSYRDAADVGVPYQEVVGNDFVRDAEDRRGLAIRYSMGHSGSDRWEKNEDPIPLPATDNYWGPAPPDVRPWPDGGLDELPMPEHPTWVVVGNATVEPHAVEPNVLSPEEVRRYLDEGAQGPLLGGPSAMGLVAGLLVGIGSSILYGWRRRG